MFAVRERFRPFDPCREAVRRRELSQHDRGRFIEQTTSGQAKHGVFTEPFGRQVFFADHRQVFMGRIFSHAFHRGRGFCIGGRMDLVGGRSS